MDQELQPVRWRRHDVPGDRRSDVPCCVYHRASLHRRDPPVVAHWSTLDLTRAKTTQTAPLVWRAVLCGAVCLARTSRGHAALHDRSEVSSLSLMHVAGDVPESLKLPQDYCTLARRVHALYCIQDPANPRLPLETASVYSILPFPHPERGHIPKATHQSITPGDPPGFIMPYPCLSPMSLFTEVPAPSWLWRSLQRLP
jgi:hypothetical protein